MNMSSVSQAWLDRAHELVRWTQQRMVNRTDVWGGYCRLDKRSKEFPGAFTKPSLSKRGKRALGYGTLFWSFGAGCYDINTAPERLVGLHAISQENTSLWGAVDVDWHGPDSTSPGINLAAALGWFDKLTSLGFKPLLTDSNGKGGYHIRVLFSEAISSATVYAFMGWLVSDYAKYGMTAPPETFPKQPAVDERTQFGNWLRLPGRHHTRDYWSSVWDGTKWLEGGAAIEFILSLKGDSAHLVPAESVTFGMERYPERQNRICSGSGSPSIDIAPRGSTITTGSADDPISRRIQAYIAKLPNLNDGQGRDHIAYQLAGWLVRDLALSDSDALSWLGQWDSGNRPPKGTGRLAEIIANVHHYGRSSYGAGLVDNRPEWKPGQLRADLLAEIAHLGELEIVGSIQFGSAVRSLFAGNGGASEGVSCTPHPSGTAANIDTWLPDYALADAANYATDAHAEEPLNAIHADAIDERIASGRQAARAYAPPCERASGLWLDHRYQPTSMILDLRCESPWSRCECVGCRTMRLNEWKANVRIRLAAEKVDQPMWVYYCTEEEWDPTVRLRCYRACKCPSSGESTPAPGALPPGGFLRVYHPSTGKWLVVSSKRIKDAQQMDADEAIRLIVLCLESFTGFFRPIYANPRWDLPHEEKKKESKWKVRGKIEPEALPAADKVLDVAAAKDGIEVKEILVKLPRARRVGRMRIITRPQWWGSDRIAHLLFKVQHAEPDLPFEVSERVYGEDEWAEPAGSQDDRSSPSTERKQTENGDVYSVYV
ncbi:MAG: hypothetical protein KGL39_07835 [Patescibacteria group bacterium]|nr:hypothetical protein [Patescibacteria group bacterium]